MTLTTEQIKNKYHLGCVVKQKHNNIFGKVVAHNMVNNILCGISIEWDGGETKLSSNIGITNLDIVDDNKLDGLFYAQ